MMNPNPRPTPSFDWMPRSWTAVMIPQIAATNEVAMNRRIFVRLTGTPTFRAATGSPPELKIQLPKRVRDSTHAATAVNASHQTTATLRAYFDHTNEANSLCANPKPGA